MAVVLRPGLSLRQSVEEVFSTLLKPLNQFKAWVRVAPLLRKPLIHKGNKDLEFVDAVTKRILHGGHYGHLSPLNSGKYRC